jgi:hypothetical protein
LALERQKVVMMTKVMFTHGIPGRLAVAQAEKLLNYDVVPYAE